MLLAFSVTNFKSIKETQTISMAGTSLAGPHAATHVDYPGQGAGVLPCAIIYGANASGKSNLLDAIFRMRQMVRLSQSDSQIGKKLQALPFLLDASCLEQPTTFEVSFLRELVRFDYGFTFTEERICQEWLYSYPEGRRRKLFERDGMKLDFGTGMRGAKKILESFLNEKALFLSVATQNRNSELSVVKDFFENIFAINHISVASETLAQSFLKEDVDGRTIKFLEAIGTGVCEYKMDVSEFSDEQKTVFSALGEFFANLKIPTPDIELLQNNYEVKLGHRSVANDVVYFGGEAESAGTRRLLLLLNGVFKVLDNGDIAMIDEIDASLHTHAVEAIVQLFLNPNINTKGAQLIATTHDTNLMNPEILRRDEIWFSEKDMQGASQYFSLAEVKRRKLEVFEKSYLQGRYGAVPSNVTSRLFYLKN